MTSLRSSSRRLALMIPSSFRMHATSATLPDGGTLLGDGAGVSVSASFDCEAGWSANVWVEAAQRTQGNRVATGMGYSETVECAAGAESVDVVLLAAGDFLAFEEGDAVVRVSVSACSTQTCDQAVAAGVVQFSDEDE